MVGNKHRGRIPATPILLTNQLTNNNLIYDEKTNCVLMVQRYKHCPSTTNLFSEPPIFFNKTVWKTHIKECSCYELFKRK